MKYGKQMQLRMIEEWREHYLRYNELKDRIKAMKQEKMQVLENGGTWDVDGKKAEFLAAIKEEVGRVNSFFLRKNKEVRAAILQLKEKYKLATTPRRRASSVTEAVVGNEGEEEEEAQRRRNNGEDAETIKGEKEEEEVWADVMVVSALLARIEDYVQVNFTGFEKILKKHDKHMDTKLKKAAMPFISSSDFYANDLHKRKAPLHKILRHANAIGLADIRKSIPAQIKQTPPKALMVEDLDLNQLPKGQISRLWVPLTEDALSQPITVPVMVACGLMRGPTVAITAAMHGNELNGIPLIHRLFKEIDPTKLCGSLIAVPVVNVPGYHRNQREFSDGEDLNRVFPGSMKQPSKAFAQRFLMRIISKVEYLIDLHTASFGRINSLYVRADMNDPITARMAYLQEPQIIVHNTGPDGSLRGAAADLGINAITVEIGNPSQFQKRYITHALLGVHNILCYLKMIPEVEEEQQPPPPPEQQPSPTSLQFGAHYEVTLCSKSYWSFTDMGGVLEVLPEINSWVRKGQTVAVLRNIFGDVIKKYHALDDGIVVGKNCNPVAQTGDRIMHLGVPGTSFSKEQQDGHEK
ncbi:SPX domain-containing protein [Balamuthia mandrillaris]